MLLENWTENVEQWDKGGGTTGRKGIAKHPFEHIIPVGRKASWNRKAKGIARTHKPMGTAVMLGNYGM